ncbi:MAG TPA: serine protease [Vicinamibacterales bacterium]|nr:serine protease [Vicinamibacterales bacterium]
MTPMFRALVLATLFLVVPRADAVQALRVLHIKIVLVDAAGKATPIPHYLLLVSDNPATALPRRVVTALDGTADVSLRPGNYTVESDRPVAFGGKAYQWTQIVDVVAGRDAVLELKADNAEVVTATSETASAALLESDPSSLLALWQDSVVAIWTPTTHASGFVFDAKGLIATSQQVIGKATSVEVQLTPAIKVAARVLMADAVRDVAVLAIDPKVLASVRAVPLACAQPRKPVAEGQELFTIGAPLRGPKGTASGTISRVEPHAIVSDLILAAGSAGGPVFNAGGDLVGITTLGDDRDEGTRRRTRIARMDDACGVIASAESKLKDGKPPDAAHLPVEPLLPFPAAAFKEAAKRRAGSLSPYQMATTDFDVNFITPILIYGAEVQSDQVTGRERGTATRKPAEPALVRPLLDFSNWSEYMSDYPPVLLIRVTPKLVENFWTTIARGAARTQGLALPPIKHFKSGFSRMRAYCGDAEVTPIHPFKLEQRVSENEAIYEGLYVFDPGALGPQCGTVKLVLYSEKEPEKADTRVVDPKVIEQIWQDFAPYRL